MREETGHTFDVEKQMRGNKDEGIRAKKPKETCFTKREPIPPQRDDCVGGQERKRESITRQM